MRHLLTGAGSGIGAAVADRLHARGDELWLLARSPGRAEDLRTRYAGARAVVADLADPAALGAALDAAELPDELDSLLQVAGAVDLAPVADLDHRHVGHQLDVNLVSPMLLTARLLPALRATEGLVVLVNSTAGLSAAPTWSAYAASKFGLRAFADSLRAEEAEHGVRVTTVFPSRTATPMQQQVRAQEGAGYDPAMFLRAETVADAVVTAIDLPRDATMPEVVLRPGPQRGAHR